MTCFNSTARAIRVSFPAGHLALVVSFLAAVAPATAASSDGNPTVWKPRVTSVAVFKNNLGFFLAEGETGFRDGWCVSGQVPPAAFGTLAYFAHDDKLLVDMVASGPGREVRFDGVDEPDDPAVKRARLEAMADLKVELSYKRDGRTRTAAGKLKAVGPEYAILANESEDLAVSVADIERILLLDLPLRVHVTGEDGSPAERARLGLGYLRKDITWIPEYTLKIIDDQTAELSLRGTLVNEAEDLIHCDVNFVVGVPHFVHTDCMAPLAIGQVIRTIGTAVVPREIQSQVANRAMIVSNEEGRPRVIDQPVPPAAGDIRKSLGNLPQLEAAGAGDYTVYTRKDMTVRRGEKAIVTLFTRRITYSHAYRWTVPGTIDHFLVLANSSDTAWTTGPCLALSGGQPLGEDLLRYTAKGAYGELPVATAINIAHGATEVETARQLKAFSNNHDYFDLVTLAGEVKLTNYEKRVAVITVLAPIVGKPLEAGDGGELTANTDKLALTERSGSIRWKVELQPGQTRVLTYAAERYVPTR